ncbi:MAG: hypothetical protein HC889_16125 [Synechococcaceae cyanobacterium SM1_2_3]|nr:hypothetical protein [Synechococcaceae cyanobacterium SM1_2_3]
MRRPTPNDDALAWWRAALAGQKPAITSEPHPGYYRRRLVKDGPWVPVAIWLDQQLDADGELTQPERLLCAVNGKRADPAEEWLWVCNNPVSYYDYAAMVERVKIEGQGAQYSKPDLLVVPIPRFKT